MISTAISFVRIIFPVTGQATLITSIPDDAIIPNATGDGVTDDTDAIQKTIDEAPEGATIFLPKGTYRINTHIKITKSLTLLGESSNETILKFKDDFSFAPGPIIYVKPDNSTINNLTVAQLQLDGNSPNTNQAGEWNHCI